MLQTFESNGCGHGAREHGCRHNVCMSVGVCECVLCYMSESARASTCLSVPLLECAHLGLSLCQFVHLSALTNVCFCVFMRARVKRNCILALARASIANTSKSRSTLGVADSA